MSEPHQEEGRELTLAEWKDAVKATGWTIAFVAYQAGDVTGIRVKLDPPTNKRQSHVPSELRNQLAVMQPLLMAEKFGERSADGFRYCPQCNGCYAASMWQDVLAMCESGKCPLRSVK
jgi:hypothetical protein